MKCSWRSKRNIMSQKMIDCKEDQGRLLSFTAAEEVLNWQSFIPPQLSIVPADQSPSNDSDMIDSSDFDSDYQLADLTGFLMADPAAPSAFETGTTGATRPPPLGPITEPTASTPHVKLLSSYCIGKRH
ncbi:hypothetical protein P3X46_025015 [Hevea brasiliensis]|uniref:Uncharacterized protein n=1 Tax=Hevea brasiliensis TaxID=3981 RepID=A0ABQ9L7I7_HEVBR|nr:hypothetical protein P3X46_025015 [Hevea brasiliensis]